jgi:hypothetical protein
MENSGPGPPAIYDFSQKAMQSAVVKEGVGGSLTLYPVTIGALCGFAGWLLAMPVLYFGLVGGLCAASLNAIVKIFFLSDKIENSLRSRMRRAMEVETEKQIERLQEKLQNLGEARGVMQIDQLQNGFRRFKEKLELKVGCDKPEYEQYLGTAQAMYLAALNNLNLVVDNLLDMKVIDITDCQRRIRELQSDRKKGNGEEIEYKQRQVDCYQLAEKNADDLKTEVEGAIATLLEVTRSLSDVVGYESLTMNVKASMGKFTDIAARNKKIYEKIAENWKRLTETL